MHRLFGWLHVQMLDATQWAKEEDRQEILDLLEWPDIAEEASLERSDEQARSALAKLGITLAPMDPVPGVT